MPKMKITACDLIEIMVRERNRKFENNIHKMSAIQARTTVRVTTEMIEETIKKIVRAPVVLKADLRTARLFEELLDGMLQVMKNQLGTAYT